eukprot:9392066-Heterocapsa_arctica.AAC.1
MRTTRNHGSRASGKGTNIITGKHSPATTGRGNNPPGSEGMSERVAGGRETRITARRVPGTEARAEERE